MPRKVPLAIIDVSLHWHHDTERAIMVSENGDRKKPIWLPKSMIEYERDDKGGVIVTMPTWLAEKERLL